MIAQDGLASVACESRPARVLTGIAVGMDLLTCYLFLTELFLDCNSWVQWRIPHFNAYSYDSANALTGALTTLTAVYFISFALRVRRYLSNDDNSQQGNVANKTVMQRLMRRVLASGFLMLLISNVLAACTVFVFHPTGFPLVYGSPYLLAMVNSLLQIDSFAATEAPSGPLRETLLVLQNALKQMLSQCRGAEEQRPGIKRLRFLIGEGAAPLVQEVGDGGKRGRSASVAPQQAGGTSINVQSSAGLRSFAAVLPEPETEATRLPWSSLPVSQREGVSHSFLLAVLEAWRVPAEVTMYQLCDQFVKPACRKENCGFLDVILKTKCPDDWFGPMSVFVSHWWGYKAVDLVRLIHRIKVCAPQLFTAADNFTPQVTMIGKNEEMRKAAGQPPGFYFVDIFALNQVAVDNLSANMHQVFVGQLVRDLMDTLLACNSMVLCCSAGPSGDPGWMRAAKLSRIWYGEK